MTIYFPDISHYQAGLKLNGATAVIAKATEGNYWTDLSFVNFRTQAAALGIPFLAYHFLNTGDVPGNVQLCRYVVGDAPVMLDVETAKDGGKPTLAETLEFCDRHGRVSLAYIPKWYWRDEWGSPSLAGLTSRGIGLISSSYTTYTDDGIGWTPYGGVTPVIWQYTDAHQFNGQAVDFNAFKGTVDELRAVFNGGDDMTPEQALLLHNVGWMVQGLVDNDDPIVIPAHPSTPAEPWVAKGATLPNKLAQSIAALTPSAAADHTHPYTGSVGPFSGTVTGTTGPATPAQP